MYFIRIIISALSLFILTSVCILLLYLNHCEFIILNFEIGILAGAFFLWMVGFMAYGVTGNVVVGYLLPAAYYILNFSLGGKLNNFYLFSLAKNCMAEKYWLLGVGVVFLIITLAYRQIIRRLR